MTANRFRYLPVLISSVYAFCISILVAVVAPASAAVDVYFNSSDPANGLSPSTFGCYANGGLDINYCQGQNWWLLDTGANLNFYGFDGATSRTSVIDVGGQPFAMWGDGNAPIRPTQYLNTYMWGVPLDFSGVTIVQTSGSSQTVTIETYADWLSGPIGSVTAVVPDSTPTAVSVNSATDGKNVGHIRISFSTPIVFGANHFLLSNPGANSAPTASSVTITGTAQVGVELTGGYTYADGESDAEGTSTFRWVSNGVNTGVGGGSNVATTQNYTPVAGDQGQYLYFCVTPVASDGSSPGSEVCSAATAQVPIPVDGACGSDDSGTLTSEPTQLCTTGSASTVTSGTTSYTWTCNGTNGSTVNNACSATRNYLVTPSAGANGSITPNTVQQVAYNATPNFTVTASPNHLASVGGSCGGNLVGDTYTTSAITGPCTVEASFSPESDGVDGTVEDAAPNSGDGNGDGTPDSQQPNVTSLPRPDGGYLTIHTDCPTGLTGVQTYTEASQGGGDPLYNLPYGQVGFSTACETATFTVHYHGVSSVAGMTYRKYGPATPGNPDTMAWYTLPNVTFGTVTVGGQTVATATFTLQDNQLGDDTGDDGLIVDQGGPGSGVSATAIPTLSEWSMIVLASLLAMGAGLTLRRQRQ
jgi:hypothetical protein